MPKNNKNRNANRKPKKQLSIIEGPRVRFAPAPTGHLHLGSARTILFNWLFARKYGGSFVLRIEDTDVERSDKKYEKDILEGIRWLGLDWDEGPDIGGAHGPYRQSERQEIYKKYLAKLLEEGRAYRCFCSKEDLEAERQDMSARGVPPKYSGRCRALPESKIKEYLSEGKPYILRLKMPEKKVSFEDLIHGKIEFDTSIIGDFSIAKGEDTPLYNLAVVIDDFEMKISHVIRGDEHVSNTPKQIILLEAFGLPPPAYAHIPLIFGPDRAKLSKRHGAMAVHEYRDMGYLPEALVNFLALLGWHPPGDREIFSREELIQEFSLERVQKAGAVFTQSRLDWLNGYYIRKKTSQELAGFAVPFLVNAGLLKEEGQRLVNRESGETVSQEYLGAVLDIEKERLQKFADLPELAEFFFKSPKYEATLLVWKEMSLDDIKETIERLKASLEGVGEDAFTRESVDRALQPHYRSDKGWILWPFRVALTGRKASPGPLEIAEILGKKEVMIRLEYAEKLLEKI